MPLLQWRLPSGQHSTSTGRVAAGAHTRSVVCVPQTLSARADVVSELSAQVEALRAENAGLRVQLDLKEPCLMEVDVLQVRMLVQA